MRPLFTLEHLHWGIYRSIEWEEASVSQLSPRDYLCKLMVHCLMEIGLSEFGVNRYCSRLTCDIVIGWSDINYESQFCVPKFIVFYALSPWVPRFSQLSKSLKCLLNGEESQHYCLTWDSCFSQLSKSLKVTKWRSLNIIIFVFIFTSNSTISTMLGGSASLSQIYPKNIILY